jgi:hypothetical protein
VIFPRRTHPQWADEVLIRLQVITLTNEPGHPQPNQATELLHPIGRVAFTKDSKIAHAEMRSATLVRKVLIRQRFVLQFLIVSLTMHFHDESCP